MNICRAYVLRRQARDGQFLRFAADGAASLKAYPEGPSGNCLLQVVASGSGMMKLKTNHGTYLSLTRDSSVKAVATGRTGFRVTSEGGKYVFTHESGKFLGVSAGQVCGLEKRQQERPHQDTTSDFTVVTIAEGASAATHIAAAPTAPPKPRSKLAAAVLQPASEATDPFAFDPVSAPVSGSKRINKVDDGKKSDKMKSNQVKAAPTKRGVKAPPPQPAVASAAPEDSDDDRPFKFSRAAAAASDSTPSKSLKMLAVPSTHAAVAPDGAATSRSRRGTADIPAAATEIVSSVKRQRNKQPQADLAVAAELPPQKSRKSDNTTPTKTLEKSASLDLPESFAL
jgi:hypothetical protein